VEGPLSAVLIVILFPQQLSIAEICNRGPRVSQLSIIDRLTVRMLVFLFSADAFCLKRSSWTFPVIEGDRCSKLSDL